MFDNYKNNNNVSPGGRAGGALPTMPCCAQAAVENETRIPWAFRGHSDEIRGIQGIQDSKHNLFLCARRVRKGHRASLL